MLAKDKTWPLLFPLKQGGVLALNYVGFMAGEGAAAVASVFKTLKSVFPHSRVFITEKTEMTDFIFLASAEALELDASSQDYRVQWLLAHAYPLADSGGIVVTDNYNPMESLQVRKAETYRKQFMERIAYELLLR